jgi:hypothetical protein
MYATMSDSIVPSIESPSPSVLTALRPSTTPTPTPSRRAEYRRIRAITWLLVGHKANIRRNAEGSGIWRHGDEYINLAKPDDAHAWICDHCDGVIIIPRSGTTSNVNRHLKKDHGIILKRTQNDREEEDETETILSRDSSVQQTQTAPTTFRALVTTYDVDRFRNLLIHWIVQQQIPYSAVEHTEFRDLLLYLQPSLERYLIRSHHTVANWIGDEYTRARLTVKGLLANAYSRIHLSFDIWTSPAAMPILGICAHFLDTDVRLQNPLLALRFFKGSHTGEAIAEIITGVVEEFEIQNKLGVYVADNASNCNAACRELVLRFHPNEEEGSRRSRCLGHIINLAAQAFIYGKDGEAFVNAAEYTEELTYRDQAAVAREQSLWRSRGSFGKLHNVVKHIKASPQRRQDFQAITEMIITQAVTRGKLLKR